MGKLAHSLIAGQPVIGMTSVEGKLEISMKIKVAHPFDPATPPLRIRPTDRLIRVQNDRSPPQSPSKNVALLGVTSSSPHNKPQHAQVHVSQVTETELIQVHQE